MNKQVFNPGALERIGREDIAAALRLLADHLDRKEISATFWSFQANGMVQDLRGKEIVSSTRCARAPAAHLAVAGALR